MVEAGIRHAAQAQTDMEMILRDLEGKNPAVALQYANKFSETVTALIGFPEMGRMRPEIAPDLRSVVISPYILFYRYRHGMIEIVRILHGMRDLRRMLQISPQV